MADELSGLLRLPEAKQLSSALLLANLGLSTVAAVTAFYALAVDTDFWLAVVSIAALLAITYPIQMSRSINILEPIVLVGCAVFLGTTARAFYILLSNSPRISLLTENEPLEMIAQNSLWLTLGCLSLSAGYYLFSWVCPFIRPRPAFSTAYLKGRLLPFVVIAFLSGAFLVLYLVALDYRPTGLADLAIKRAEELTNSSGENVFTRHVYLLALVSISQFALYALVIRYRGVPVGFAWWCIASVLFLISIVPFIVTSARTGIVVIIFNLTCILFIFRRLRPIHVVISITTIVAVAVIMAILRSWSLADTIAVNTNPAQYGHSEAQLENGPLANVLGSGNFVDVGRNAIIIDRVPRRVDYLYGASYLTFFTSFVPRAVWADKPEVQLGPYVKEKIFGYVTQRNGYPPTIFAEAYMNFGYLGIILVPFLYGVFLRLLFESLFRPDSPDRLLLYLAVLFPAGFTGVSLNVSAALSNLLVGLVPAAIVIVFLALCRRLRGPGLRLKREPGH